MCCEAPEVPHNDEGEEAEIGCKGRDAARAATGHDQAEQLAQGEVGKQATLTAGHSGCTRGAVACTGKAALKAQTKRWITHHSAGSTAPLRNGMRARKEMQARAKEMQVRATPRRTAPPTIMELASSLVSMPQNSANTSGDGRCTKSLLSVDLRDILTRFRRKSTATSSLVDKENDSQ